uniref:Uncharacterized protein n=1 Tax=Bombyx mori TaxID=7091 RepID=A0A8R2LX19_BOMMO|nr:myosin-9 isoform X2 [Bombyx mori]
MILNSYETLRPNKRVSFKCKFHRVLVAIGSIEAARPVTININQKQKQLGDMEGEVKEIQMEIAAIKRDRLDVMTKKQMNVFTPESEYLESTDSGFGESVNKASEERSCNLTQITKLREELIRAKTLAEEERTRREKYETKLKDLELKLSEICHKEIPGHKEYRKYTEKEVAALKTQIRELKEELEETKMTLREKNEQQQEYRLKYLQAQQEVEELKRQLDVIEFDNKQVSDQIQIEIQKVKMQFQEKLQELAPLPDLLKGAQIQLQEAKQLQRLAEDNSRQISAELHRVKEKLIITANSLEQEKAIRSDLSEENKLLKNMISEKGKEIDEISKSLDDHKSKVLRLEEKLTQQETRFTEKANECSQLLKDLDDLRQESQRSTNRNKERSDSMRRYMQTQITELERQLIQSRAQCRACQKERDEIRQRMQIQINSLQENFELVEIRLRALQNQVTSLKNSYSVILADEEDGNEYNKIATV